MTWKIIKKIWNELLKPKSLKITLIISQFTHQNMHEGQGTASKVSLCVSGHFTHSNLNLHKERAIQRLPSTSFIHQNCIYSITTVYLMGDNRLEWCLLDEERAGHCFKPPSLIMWYLPPSYFRLLSPQAYLFYFITATQPFLASLSYLGEHSVQEMFVDLRVCFKIILSATGEKW